MLSASLLVLLNGCGGGGGGVVGSLLDDSENGISFASGDVACNADPAQTCQASLQAFPNTKVAQASFNWREESVSAAGTAVVRDVNRIKQPDGSWLLHIDFKNALAPGVYRGKITLSFFDLAPLGTRILPGSFNYTLTVTAANGNLKPLVRVATDWEGFNGNAAHTGFVPLTLDVANFSHRFSRASNDNTRFDQIALADGKYLLISREVSSLPNAPVNPVLQSYSETDNTLQWRVAGSATATFFNLAASGKQVLVTSGEANGRLLTSFDSGNGSERFNHLDNYARLTSSRNDFAPVVAGNQICANNGTDGELQCLNAGNGNLQWRASLRSLVDPVFQNTAPAISNNLVLTNLNGKFSAFDRITGSLQFALAVPGPSSGSVQTFHELNQAVVVPESGSALLLDRRNLDGSPRDNTLTMVDMASQKIRWQAQGQFTAHPVASPAVVYAGNHQTRAIEARDLVSGKLLWSWPLPLQNDDAFGDNLILTNNLLLVAARNNTYAIDLASHQAVWSYHLSGKLALSAQGVLYILGADPANAIAARDWVVAINLK